jgi:alkylhydroperoxidase/carboxymuconolactone decarboxylase family protein YurZ
LLAHFGKERVPQGVVPEISQTTLAEMVGTTRSRVNVFMNRFKEFRLYVSAGLMHELEPCDLKEVLLQVAVYAGVPAANTGFRVAAEVLGKTQKEQGLRVPPAPHFGN